MIRRLPTLLMLSLASASLMAQMSVSPLRLDLSPQSSVAALTVANTNGPNPLQVQIAVESWTQSNGQDNYSNQNSILLLPPIFGVPVGQSQVVRVALLQPNTTNLEQAYRIFIKQFNPQPANVQSNSKISTNLNILLNISIPAFVAPNAPKNIALTWDLGKQNKQSLPITITNTGNTHVHFAKITLSNANGTIIAEGDAPTYVLAGATMTDALEVLKPLIKGQTYTVKAITDDPQYPTLTGQVIP